MPQHTAERTGGRAGGHTHTHARTRVPRVSAGQRSAPGRATTQHHAPRALTDTRSLLPLHAVPLSRGPPARGDPSSLVLHSANHLAAAVVASARQPSFVGIAWHCGRSGHGLTTIGDAGKHSATLVSSTAAVSIMQVPTFRGVRTRAPNVSADALRPSCTPPAHHAA